MIVRAQDDEHIFERDDQRHRPEDQAQHAEDVRLIDRQRMMPREAFLERIERRRADIAKHHSDRAQREQRERFLCVMAAGGRRFVGQCGG